MRLTSDQVESTDSGWSKSGAEEVIAHREVLCVVPEGRDGVAIIVIHHDPFVFASRTHILDELIHLAIVKSFLLIEVLVILVTVDRLRAIQSLWISQVGIVVKQLRSQAIDRRSISRCGKGRFSWRVERIGIGAEVVVERIVFIIDDYQVLNWRGRLAGCLRTWLTSL